MENTIKITRDEVLKRLKPVDPKSHKGTFGHSLIIGGSYGKIGAVCLASKAALKVGSGLVTAFLPKCGYQIIQTAIPEVMAITDSEQNLISNIQFDIKPVAIGIGPGMGQEQPTQDGFHSFLKRNDIPLVIDADAINILSINKNWMELIPAGSVITPHQKELERLIGKWATENEKMSKSLQLSTANNLTLVLKGAPTLIIENGVIYENTTGNAGLATAGTGDVLTGMITGLIAQGYSSLDAALIGVYLHGSTADLALPDVGVHAFTASDVVDNIGKAYTNLEAKI